MNKQIRKLGFVLALLFVVLFAQLNYTQVIRADELANSEYNNRNVVRDFASPRGNIQTADGALIATSEQVEGPYEYRRQYPEGALFGHLTGFFSFTFGNEGLERQYNDELTGRTFSLRNLEDILTEQERTNDVTISATRSLQQTARDALGERKGAVVALEPDTGAVLAMHSYPSYDPTALASHDFEAVRDAREALLDDPDNPLLPRAFQESYPPGSTQKVVTASAAFDRQEELTERRYPNLVFLDLPQSDQTLANFGRSRCGGTIDALLRVSCNTGFAQIGIDLGAEALFEEAYDYGYNQRPPLDMPTVAQSRFPSIERMSRNAPARAYSAIGQQDVSATPLQMAMIAAAVANDGVIMEPTLLKEVRDSRGDVIREADYQEWKRAASSDTASELKDLMIQVAERGTATNARIPGVEVGAKTGTAEIGNGRVHTWLISFAQANDRQVAVAVIVENQPGVDESTGGRVAAPIARQVMQSALGTPS